MRIGLTGYQGYLGSYLLRYYHEFFPLRCDVRFEDEIKREIDKVRPDLILHLAAKSDVDFCEKPNNQDLVTTVNLRGTYNVANIASERNMDVVLLSSDHVFGGDIWGRFFGRKETSTPHPKNFYGMSKLSAESLQAVFINLRVVRTSYLFDEKRLSKLLVDMRSGKKIDSPTFIHRSFMYLPDMAVALMQYFGNITKMPYLLHIAGDNTLSWNQFHWEISRVYGTNHHNIMARKFEDGFQDRAPRPYYGGLDVSLSKKLGLRQFHYMDGIVKMAEKKQ